VASLSQKPLPLGGARSELTLYLSKQIACLFSGLGSTQATGFETDQDVAPQREVPLGVGNLTFDKSQSMFQ
jgi:hypothetical protein